MSRAGMLAALAWSLILVAKGEEFQEGCSEEDFFHTMIPQNYRKSIPPKNQDGPSNVYVQVNVIDIFKLDESEMDYNIHMYFLEMWTDYRLQLECLQTDHPVVLTKEITDQMWFPDVYFESTKSGNLFELTVPNRVVKIFPKKFIYRSSRYLMKASCPMDLHLYPMDRQICSFKVALYSYPDDQTLIHFADEEGCPVPGLKPVEMVHQPQLPQFVLAKVDTSSHTEEWKAGNFTMLTVIFHFERQLASYLINTYIPSAMVVAMSWLSFWLDVEAVPARVTLGVTSILTIATQMVQARSSLPPVAYSNALDVWLFVCLHSVILSIVEYGMSYYLAHYSQPLHFLPVRKIADKLQAYRMMLISKRKEPNTEQSTQERRTMEVPPPSPPLSKKKSHPLDRTCRVLFPFLFLCFNIFYWSYYLGRKSD